MWRTMSIGVATGLLLGSGGCGGGKAPADGAGPYGQLGGPRAIEQYIDSDPERQKPPAPAGAGVTAGPDGFATGAAGSSGGGGGLRSGVSIRSGSKVVAFPAVVRLTGRIDVQGVTVRGVGQGPGTDASSRAPVPPVDLKSGEKKRTDLGTAPPGDGASVIYELGPAEDAPDTDAQAPTPLPSVVVPVRVTVTMWGRRRAEVRWVGRLLDGQQQEIISATKSGERLVFTLHLTVLETFRPPPPSPAGGADRPVPAPATQESPRDPGVRPPLVPPVPAKPNEDDIPRVLPR